MSIPALQGNGLLPAGIHDCTLGDIQSRFTWNKHRLDLYSQFTVFLQMELRVRFSQSVIFDGSFVTDKDLPEDTDVVLDLSSADDALAWQGLTYMKRNQDRFKSQYSVHFWVNLPGGNDFTAFFQYVGLKTARAKGVGPRHSKGILRIV